ncbi:hypothetical protein ID866_9366 [Astraeus odoratus]|nr:hypothetical protein ID866_9366 [Astraeus odoratus]
MSDVVPHHLPAVKVGGRRLSVSAKAKPHTASVTSPKTASETESADYPRPAAQEQEQQEAHEEEEAPKKEKKHGHRGHDEKRLKENPSWKVEATRPTRDNISNRHSFGGAGRIGQPVSKVFVA